MVPAVQKYYCSKDSAKFTRSATDSNLVESWRPVASFNTNNNREKKVKCFFADNFAIIDDNFAIIPKSSENNYLIVYFCVSITSPIHKSKTGFPLMNN